MIDLRVHVPVRKRQRQGGPSNPTWGKALDFHLRASKQESKSSQLTASLSPDLISDSSDVIPFNKEYLTLQASDTLLKANSAASLIS